MATCPPRRSVIGRITAILSTYRAGNAHSMTELSRLTGLPISTTHRLAAELVSWQLLQRTEDGSFEIGTTLRGLGDGTWSVPSLQERTPQVVADLCDATRQRARVGVLTGGRVAYAEKRVGPEPVTSFRQGATLPAHATAMGKALLAFAPPATVAQVTSQLPAFTARTLNCPDRLHRALRAIRLTKLAVSQGELVAGDFAIAVPVFAPDGAVVAALELQVTDSLADFQACRAALTVAARALSRDLAAAPTISRPHLHAVASPPPPPSEPLRSAVGG